MPLTSPLIWTLSLSQDSFLILLVRQMRVYLASGEVSNCSGAIYRTQI